MAISFENSNKPVTWGELVNFLAEMHASAEVAKAKQSGAGVEIAHALRNLSPCPGKGA
jgi:hypothetical protein